MACPENDEVKAVITGFSNHGDLVFASTKEYGDVTFKHSLDVWSGIGSLQKGELVILSQMTRFTKGWRAAKARRFVLTDESKNSNDLR